MQSVVRLDALHYNINERQNRNANMYKYFDRHCTRGFVGTTTKIVSLHFFFFFVKIATL